MNFKHPITIALVLLCTLRVAALSITAIIKGDSASNASLTVLLHVGFTLVLGCCFLLLWLVVRVTFLRVCVTAIALVLLSASLFLSLSDPILDAIIGERLTPSTLAHFAGPGLFLSDYFWKPVFHYWYAVFPAVTLLAAYLIWMLLLFWNVGLKPDLTPVRWTYPAAGAAIGLAIAFGADTASGSLLPPVEFDYVTEAVGVDGTRLRMSEEEAAERIRAFVGLPEGASWVDEDYPLVYRWESMPKEPISKPDIFIFVVESLRGASLRPVNPTGQNFVSVPAIEELARNGVVFQRFLSNGFPSGPGFVGISSGAWMHPVKRLDGAYASTSFDRLGKRLRSNGYRTGIITYDVRYDDKENWVYGVFEDVLASTDLGFGVEDRVTVDQFNQWVATSDAQDPARPLFGILLTLEPHLPYSYTAPDGRWTAGPNLAENYAHSILEVDAELKRAFDFLKSRPRWKNTVVIIVGDHANFLDQSISTGLPVDDTVFTGAIISGGDPVIGPPRESREPASHSDIASTVLALSGDWRPAMALGRNLLSNDPGRSARALAIRNGGTRLDMSGVSMMIPKGSGEAAEMVVFDQTKSDAGEAVPTPAETVEAVQIWSWMIENDRVWDESFLDPH
jgi:hypothetical protein